MRPTRTQAIKTFLAMSTHADLASLYSHDMEVQVNVAQDGGNRIDGDFKGRQWHGFSDGFQVWKPIRIPYNANSEPEYVDIEITYDIAMHAEGIGMTGWDWANKLSRWVAFDFDAISGHSDKHTKKMTDEELVALRETVQNIDWVTLRRSTSGKGLHLYVFLNPVSTSNHSEHAALARAILSKMSAVAGFDFSMKVDTCGSNMWVWHRKMRGTNGLELLKAGTTLADIPANWRDHVKVVTGRRTMNLPTFIADQEASVPGIEDKFAELCGQRIRVPLDEEHRRLLEWLDHRYPNSSWWDSDHWMLVTHTTLLAEAHEELNMKGLFATLATGREKGNDWNCYTFPMRKGAWSVRRYSPGCQEHVLWMQDGQGWTRCFLNRLPDIVNVCRMFGGIEDAAGGYYFSSAEQAKKAALHLGADLDIPNWALTRKCKLKKHKSGRLIVEMKHDSDDPPIQGWLGEKSKWQKLFDVKNSEPNEPEVVVYDEEVRHLITESGEDYGWVIYSDQVWHNEPYQNVKCYLSSRGHKADEVTNILGSSIARHWTLVNLPFEPEYPKDRRWNRGAAQYRFKPTINRDGLEYGTWLKVLRHLGQGLNEAVKNNDWAKANGVLTGADYLKCWVSSLFKFPCKPLPYLFFYGPQDSGKSIFHEALQLLVVPSSVVVRADAALTSQSNFNGELENCILAVIEETDLQRNKTAYNRIKDWVTSLQLPIHKKQKQPYTIRNTTHWVQCVPATVIVDTAEGPRSVADLKQKSVTIQLNNHRYETKGFFSTGKKEVFLVETVEGYCFEATSDHLAQVSYDGLKLWTEVGKLRVGDSLCLSEHTDYQWGDSLFEEGYIIGFLIGDGSLRKTSRSQSFDPVIYIYEDFDILDYIMSILTECKVSTRNDGATTVAGLQLKNLCRNYGVTSKSIPIGQGSSFYEGLICALFDTDGSVSNDRLCVNLYQSDRKLLQMVQSLLLKFGVKSSIYEARKAGSVASPKGGTMNAKASYSLCIRNLQNLIRFSRRIGFKIQRKCSALSELLTSWTRNAIVPEFTARVEHVSSLGLKETYDITVPEAHAFIGDGFVLHNCANSQLACPCFSGDTRITMCYVPELPEGTKIPKRDIIKLLELEAADFMTEILGLELPPSNDRLNVPVIRTEDKAMAEEANQTFLEMFLRERVYAVDGKRLAFSDVYDRFIEWLDPNYVKEWSKIRFGREMPPKFPKGRLPATGQHWFGNISWEPRAASEEIMPKLVVKNGFLINEDQ